MNASPEPVVSALVVRALAAFVEQAGVPRADFLRSVRIELDASDARIALSLACELCELALDLTGDPALGLHWAESIGDSTFVPLSHVIAHAGSLGDALDSLLRFSRLLSERESFHLVEMGEQIALRCLGVPGQTPRVQRFVTETMTAGLYRLFRYFGNDARPQHVNFAYPAPTHRAEYERIFEHSARFDQPFTELVFARALLEAPAREKDDDVYHALREIAERRLLEVTRSSPYALRVRALLVQQGRPQQSSMESIARALGFSTRSLRRRLADEGTSFNDVVSEAFAIVAKQLLRDRQLSIQETAFAMGFADASAFHHAFKRWTGTTPSAFQGPKA